MEIIFPIVHDSALGFPHYLFEKYVIIFQFTVVGIRLIRVQWLGLFNTKRDPPVLTEVQPDSLTRVSESNTPHPTERLFPVFFVSCRWTSNRHRTSKV